MADQSVPPADATAPANSAPEVVDEVPPAPKEEEAV